jgi:hypothetical protein
LKRKNGKFIKLFIIQVPNKESTDGFKCNQEVEKIEWVDIKNLVRHCLFNGLKK